MIVPQKNHCFGKKYIFYTKFSLISWKVKQYLCRNLKVSSFQKSHSHISDNSINFHQGFSGEKSGEFFFIHGFGLRNHLDIKAYWLCFTLINWSNRYGKCDNGRFGREKRTGIRQNIVYPLNRVGKSTTSM